MATKKKGGPGPRGTVKQFLERLGLDEDRRQVVYHFLHFTAEMGLAKIVGVEPSPNGKGKGSNVYEFVTDYETQFANLVRKL